MGRAGANSIRNDTWWLIRTRKNASRNPTAADLIKQPSRGWMKPFLDNEF
jgi:hypothetical protein